MKNAQEFLTYRNTASGCNIRLKEFVKEYQSYKQSHPKPLKILDIGCGLDCVLFQYKYSEDVYYGCDFYNELNLSIDDYRAIDLMQSKLTELYKDEAFDLIFCGEVIEHLFSPDSLLDEIKHVMHEESILILSTPNLGYYANRIMLLFGISPLFLENSSEQKLGRKCKFLGQGNKTEGHIRLFTYGALKDLLKNKKFQIIRIKSVPIWNNFIDRMVCFLSKSLSANNIFVLCTDPIKHVEQHSMAIQRVKVLLSSPYRWHRCLIMGWPTYPSQQ